VWNEPARGSEKNFPKLAMFAKFGKFANDKWRFPIYISQR